jgi:aminomethyltransferase
MKKTPLYDVHRDLAAKMVPFGGWEMPVEYSGLIAEHNAVRKAAGLFDVSHMGEFTVEGPGALAFLQRVTCNDVARLVDGQAQYSALPMANGAPVDDVIVYRRAADRYLLVVNAGNLQKDWAWLNAQAPTGCELVDRSDDYALIALQGPMAQEIFQPLTPHDLSSIAFYHFAESQACGHPVTISRTGYTGEDGFEIFIAPDRAEQLFRALLEAGKERGVLPAGLGARDTLRLEAKMCLYGNDLDEEHSLIEAGLGWIVCLDESKGDFNGREVLARHKKEGAPHKLAGFEMVGRGIARHGYPVWIGAGQVGAVASGSYAPFLQKNIGLAYLPAEKAAVGSELDVEIRGHRVPARVVPTPFYKRPRPKSA